jgi:hypothetical protein
MKHRALTHSEQAQIAAKLDDLIESETDDVTNIANTLTDFIRTSFKLSEDRAFEIAAGYVISRARRGRTAIARQLREAAAESFPDEKIPALHFFVLLQSPVDADDQPLDSTDDVMSFMQASRLSLRWTLSRKRAFARHPECGTLPDLEAALRSEHPESKTAGELQIAIERDNQQCES